LYHAAQYDQQQAAYAADWQQARRADYAARQQAFDDARGREVEWQAWHEEYQADEQRRWADEHIRRATNTTVTAQRTIVYADSADEAEETKLDLRF